MTVTNFIKALVSWFTSMDHRDVDVDANTRQMGRQVSALDIPDPRYDMCSCASHVLLRHNLGMLKDCFV